MVTPLEAVSSSGTGLPSPVFRRVVVANADAIAPTAHKSKIIWEMYIKSSSENEFANTNFSVYMRNYLLHQKPYHNEPCLCSVLGMYVNIYVHPNMSYILNRHTHIIC